MNKKIISLLICLFILAGLIMTNIYIKNSKLKNPPDESHDEFETYTISEYESSQLSEIKINGQEEILLQKYDDEWLLKTDKDIIIDQSKTKIIANAITNITSNKIVSNDLDNIELSEFGLDNPQLVVEGSFNNNEKIVLNIGNNTPDKEYYYIMMDGDSSIYLIADYSVENFIITDIDLIDIEIDMPDVNNLNYLYFKGKDKEPIEIIENIELSDEDKEYYANMGIMPLIMKNPLENQKIYNSYFNDEILIPILNLSIYDTFALEGSNDIEKYGFDNPNFHLIAYDSESNIELIVGDEFESGFMYCSINGRNEVFIIDTSLIEPLINVDSFSIIEKFVSLVSIDEIDSLEIISDNKEYIAELNYSFTMSEDIEGNEIEDRIMKPTINSIVINENEFKSLYRTIIGISYDSIIEKDFEVIEETPEVIITFNKNSGNENIINEYFNYNENFYVVKINGQMGNIVSKKTISDMFNYIEKIMNQS